MANIFCDMPTGARLAGYSIRHWRRIVEMDPTLRVIRIRCSGKEAAHAIPLYSNPYDNEDDSPTDDTETEGNFGAKYKFFMLRSEIEEWMKTDTGPRGKGGKRRFPSTRPRKRSGANQTQYHKNTRKAKTA